MVAIQTPDFKRHIHTLSNIYKGDVSKLNEMRKFISIRVSSLETSKEDACTIAAACNPEEDGAMEVSWYGQNCPKGVNLFNAMVEARKTQNFTPNFSRISEENRLTLERSNASGNRHHLFPMSKRAPRLEP